LGIAFDGQAISETGMVKKKGSRKTASRSLNVLKNSLGFYNLLIL
jgi:hypothetical protein